MKYLTSIWDMAGEAAPWLLFGLIAAAIVKALVPTRWISAQLGSAGIGSVFKGSVIGIPLPLCSCGVLPTALGLRRQGAGKPATVSFLVSTPEIGLDSFLLSFALLGPFMAIVRPISAFCSAVLAGLMTLVVDRKTEDTGISAAQADASSSCCCGSKQAASAPPSEAKSCCSTKSQAQGEACAVAVPGVMARLADGLKYVFTTLWDDIKIWMAVAVILAGLAMAYTDGHPAEFLQRYGSGPAAMLIMLLVGIPLYICATASTPIAAALLAAGMSPGTVLVLLLAGPATNIGSIAILRKELGTPVLLAYLLAIAIASMGAGMIVDAIVIRWQVNIAAQVEHSSHLMPHWFGTTTAVLLILLAIRPLRNALFSWRGNRSASPITPTPVADKSCCGTAEVKHAQQPPCH